ncbi:hypothetical protein H2200_008511 [Cladophialophora chaetospira]|uniref:Uncharacterized protein n=1 Tax=Cladophialophora chaetospira TaxID=386627 RepID=A0AA38X5W7_9EURO|nr:hypothetical protein H2200_008511 [Cladophialophora chaetospira]
MSATNESSSDNANSKTEATKGDFELLQSARVSFLIALKRLATFQPEPNQQEEDGIEETNTAAMSKAELINFYETKLNARTLAVTAAFQKLAKDAIEEVKQTWVQSGYGEAWDMYEAQADEVQYSSIFRDVLF